MSMTSKSSRPDLGDGSKEADKDHEHLGAVVRTHMTGARNLFPFKFVTASTRNNPLQSRSGLKIWR